MSNLHGYALAGLNLVSFDLAAPNIALTSVPIAGLTAGETLVGIDFRPVNGLLYGLGVNAGADTGDALRHLHPHRRRRRGRQHRGRRRPAAREFRLRLQSVGRPHPRDHRHRAELPPQSELGRDRRRRHVDPGAPGIPAYDVSGVAYTNNRPDNGNITTLYALDALSDFLNVQNPPNGGDADPGRPARRRLLQCQRLRHPARRRRAGQQRGDLRHRLRAADRRRHRRSLRRRPARRRRHAGRHLPRRRHAHRRLRDPEQLRRHSRRRALGRRHDPGPLRQRGARNARRQRDQRDRRRRDAGRHRLSSADRRALRPRGGCRRGHRHALSAPGPEAAPRPRSACPAALRSSPAAARSTCRPAATAWTSIRPSTASASPPNPGSTSASIPTRRAGGRRRHRDRHQSGHRDQRPSRLDRRVRHRLHQQLRPAPRRSDHAIHPRFRKRHAVHPELQLRHAERAARRHAERQPARFRQRQRLRHSLRRGGDGLRQPGLRFRPRGAHRRGHDLALRHQPRDRRGDRPRRDRDRRGRPCRPFARRPAGIPQRERRRRRLRGVRRQRAHRRGPRDRHRHVRLQADRRDGDASRQRGDHRHRLEPYRAHRRRPLRVQ